MQIAFLLQLSIHRMSDFQGTDAVKALSYLAVVALQREVQLLQLSAVRANDDSEHENNPEFAHFDDFCNQAGLSSILSIVNPSVTELEDV